MTTLIIPCAGKSSRFPNMKPKWLLTHSDGSLMIEKSLEGLNCELFDQIILTIVKEHDEEFEASLILKQVFKNNPKIKICILDDFTKSASETVYLTLQKQNITGNFVIKDSDNYVKINLPKSAHNYIVGYDIHKHTEVPNVPNKSFLIVNEQNLVQDIIEKRVVSHTICLGIYAFKSAETFTKAYLELVDNEIENEMFVSYVISYLLSKNNILFEYFEAKDYQDWGTLDEWRGTQKSYKTYFVDVDGVLLKNCGKYGKLNWSNNEELILENVSIIKKMQDNGAQIVVTTSRTDEYKEALEKLLNKSGIFPHSYVMGLNHNTRILINDFAPTNPYPSGVAVNVPRNGLIKDYLV